MKKKEQKKPQENVKPSRVPALAVSLAGLLAGALILWFHVLNNVYRGYYYSNNLFFTMLTPDTFEFLNRVSGIGIIVMSFGCLLYAFFLKGEIDSLLKKKYITAIIILLCAISLVEFSCCYHKFFHNDEIEHLHSAWYIKQGYIPYKDFFQHHNPLLWYLILPFLYLFGDSVNTLLAVRIFMGIVTAGIAYFTYLIAFTISRSKETGIISVVLLSSTVLFMEKSIEIRPDVPQVLFGMVSIYLFIRFLHLKVNKYIFFSGLSAAVSFLFLQKTVFLLLSYAMIFAYVVVKKEIKLRSPFYFLCGFIPPLMIFLTYLQISGSFYDYFLTNWRLNMSNLGSRQISLDPLKPIIYAFSQNPVILIIIILAVIFLFLNKKTLRDVKVVTFLGVVQLLSLISYSVTFKHYYLFAVPLLCITGSYYLTSLLDTFKVIETYRIALVGILIFGAAPFLLVNTFHSNHLQLAKMKYVLEHTKENEMVYDGLNTFNIFRHDVHYFWYQLGVIPEYNKLTGNKYGNYDICSEIRSKKPKMISFNYNYECGSAGLYGPTPYPHLFISKEGSSTMGQ